MIKDTFVDDIGIIRDCIGCGFCCTKAKCEAGQRLYPSADICPALKWNGYRHVCDLMMIPGKLGNQYKKELHAGEGCCSNLNSWRNEPLVDRTKSFNKIDNPIPSIMQKFLFALGSEMIAGDTIMLIMYKFVALLENDGMDKEEATFITNKCISLIKNQRSGFNDEFMGKVDDRV